MVKPTPPRRNLPPAAEAWGRYVEKQLEGIDNVTRVYGKNIQASTQGIAATAHHTAEHKREVDGRLEHVDEALEVLDDHLENLNEDLEELHEVTLPGLNNRLDDAFGHIDSIESDIDNIHDLIDNIDLSANNMLENGDFETGDLTGWHAASGYPMPSVAQSATAHSGQYVAQMDQPSTTYAINSEVFPAQQEQAFSAELWYRNTGNQNTLTLYIVARTAEESTIIYTALVSPLLEDGEWHRVRLIANLGFGEFSGEIPEGEELVNVQILVVAGVSSGSLELDTVSLIDVTDVYEIASAPAQEAINTAREAQEIVQAMRDKGENFIINGGFENGYEGWPSLSGNRRLKETEDARTGNFVYEIDARSVSAYTVSHSDLYPTLEEATYYVEIWARKNDDSQDGGVVLAINETYSASSRIDFLEVPSSELPYNEWARVRGYVTIPEGWRAVRFAFGSNGPSYYFDDVFVADVTEAYQARQTADQAMTMAGTKNTVTYSDGPPVGIGQTVGDTHRQRDDNGNIEAEWSWDGADWVPQQITSEAITNLDVGKLTAGSAAIDDLVAQRIGAATGEFIELATDQLIASEAGFDTAVANQMFVDIFTANQVTADQIDVNSIASHSAFVEDLFSQNIGVSGELIASSGNFSTILSQYGLQTFSHQSLVDGGTWNLGDLNIYSNYPPSVQRIGDHIYYTVNDGTVLRKYSLSSNSVDSSLNLPHRAIRGIYSDGVSRLVMSLLPEGSSTMQIAVVNTNDMTISNSFNLDLADRSVDAIHPDGTILGWHGPFSGQPVLYDLNGNELRRFDFEDVTGRMAMSDDYIFAANTVISPGHLPTVVQFDKNTGQEVHRYVGTYAYFLGVSDDIVWIVPRLNQDDQHPMYGYDINTHNPRAVVMLPNDGRDTNAVIWENGRINKVSANDWESDVDLLESFSLDVGELERVSIDNITGSLTAVEANIRSLEVDEIRADPENIDFRVHIIRPRLDHPAVTGAINRFQSIAEADAFFDSHTASRVNGTEILVDGVKYVWRWDSPSSQTGSWVPYSDFAATGNTGVIQGNHGTRNGHARAAWMRSGDIVYLQGTVTRGNNDDYSTISLYGLPAPESQRRFIVAHTSISGNWRDPWVMVIYEDGTAEFFEGQVANNALNLDGLSYIIPDIGNI